MFDEEDVDINPAGSYPADEDVILDKVDILNWTERGKSTFRPRLHTIMKDFGGISLAEDDEYDCD